MELKSVLEKKLRDGVKDKVRLFPDGDGRFRVYTPFVYDDGDHIGVVLRREHDGWLLSDEGSTYMRLTLKIDEDSLFDADGNRFKIIMNTLSSFEIEDRDGELTTSVQDEDYGSALYKFIQGIIKISDLNYLSRERVSSTFIEDFQELISDSVPENRYTFNWYDTKRDSKKIYSVDCRVNGMQKPLFIYALQNDSKVRNATIGVYKFKESGIPFQPVGIFENQSGIAKNTLDRFKDVCEITYPNIRNSKEQFSRYLKEKVSV